MRVGRNDARRLRLASGRAPRASAGVGGRGRLLESAAAIRISRPMIELNPVRQRIADLTGRLDALRGYL